MARSFGVPKDDVLPKSTVCLHVCRMTCEDCLNLLSARLDGELPSDDRVQLPQWNGTPAAANVVAPAEVEL